MPPQLLNNKTANRCVMGSQGTTQKIRFAKKLWVNCFCLFNDESLSCFHKDIGEKIKRCYSFRRSKNEFHLPMQSSPQDFRLGTPDSWSAKVRLPMLIWSPVF